MYRGASLKSFQLFLFVLFFNFLFSFKAGAWGERGHHVICEVATRLVSNSELSYFLRGRGHQSGHVCNIPDIHWKDHSQNNKTIDASHFMNPENLGFKISEVPIDFSQIAKDKAKSKDQVGLELGTLWWRAEQFYQRAIEAVKLAKKSDFPDKNQIKETNHPYNKGVFEYLVNISLMGHFVGDASVPYHNTSDYDGWEKGRGGIHSYYESFSVEAMGVDLEKLVFDQARSLKKGASFKEGRGVVEIMKDLSMQSVKEISLIEDLDPMSSPSDKNTKTYAKRPSAEKGAELFGGLIIKQMARSSFALAKLWESAWEEGGSVSFKGYRSYQYPLAPEIVPPDYLGN